MRRLTEDFEARERKSVNRSQRVERNNKGDIKMMKQMKRTVYEAPVTERFQVELEGGFMSASITDDDGKGTGVTIGAQEYESFDGAAGFETGSDGGIKWE